MAKVRLTDDYIRSRTRPDKGNVIDYDTEAKGLAVRFTATGIPTFLFCYGSGVAGGSARRMVLGPWSDASGKRAASVLPKMRAEAVILAGMVAAKRDPYAERVAEAEATAAKREAERQERERAAAEAEEERLREEREITVGQLCEKYVAGHAVHKRSCEEDKRRIKRHIIPRWGDRKAKSISRTDVQDLLADLYDAGKNAEAQHCRALVSKIYNFARGHRKIDIEDNPCFGLPKIEKHQKVKPRRRALTTQQELSLFWRVTSGRSSWLRSMPQVEADCLRFMLLTGCRPSEAAELPWSEIDLDADEWVLPESRSKNEETHLVPLRPAAKAIVLKYWVADSRRRGIYVFPGPRGGSQTENRLANVMRRVCARMERLAARYRVRFEKVTPHDLRRSVETGMAAAKVPKEYRDRVLNHKDSSVGGEHYNVHDYVDEKREALKLWVGRLEGLLGVDLAPRSEQSNVIDFRAVAGGR